MTVKTLTFQAALNDAVLYPNGRLTCSFAGYTDRGRHSHIAIYNEDTHTTHTLCGLTNEHRTVWPQGDRSNISCLRCNRIAEKAGVGVGRRS